MYSLILMELDGSYYCAIIQARENISISTTFSSEYPCSDLSVCDIAVSSTTYCILMGSGASCVGRVMAVTKTATLPVAEDTLVNGRLSWTDTSPLSSDSLESMSTDIMYSPESDASDETSLPLTRSDIRNMIPSYF